MAENRGGYAGKINNCGTQVVEALHKQSSTHGATKSLRGDDLRSNTGSSGGAEKGKKSK